MALCVWHCSWYLGTANCSFMQLYVIHCLRYSEFVRAALSFPKPLVAAVNGQAIGCGVAILPLCDVVYASDKATFYTPYTQLGQVPEAGLSCSLSLIIGMALVSNECSLLKLVGWRWVILSHPYSMYLHG